MVAATGCCWLYFRMLSWQSLQAAGVWLLSSALGLDGLAQGPQGQACQPMDKSDTGMVHGFRLSQNSSNVWITWGFNIKN